MPSVVSSQLPRGAVLISQQAIGFLISWDERGHALREAYKGEFLSRAEAVARLLETTPPSIEDDITRANGTLNTRYWVTAEGPAEPDLPPCKR